jgi:hypothetical protein
MSALIPHVPDALVSRELEPRRNWPAVLGLATGMLSLVPGFGLLLGPLAIGFSRLGLHLAPRRGGRRLAVASLTAAVALFSLHATLAVLVYWMVMTCPR